jgi:hypothetical protein
MYFTKLLGLIICHNCFVLVMNEHCFEWVDLVRYKDGNNEGDAYAFLNRRLSIVGAP